MFAVLGYFSTSIDADLDNASRAWEFDNPNAHVLLTEAYELLLRTQKRYELGYKGNTFDKNIGALIGDYFKHTSSSSTPKNLEDATLRTLRQLHNNNGNTRTALGCNLHIHESLWTPVLQLLANKGLLDLGWPEDELKRPTVPHTVELTEQARQLLKRKKKANRRKRKKKKPAPKTVPVVAAAPVAPKWSVASTKLKWGDYDSGEDV